MPAGPSVQTVSPFQLLQRRLAGIAPGMAPILLHLGEPQHGVPDFIGPALAEAAADFGRYPAIRGTDAFRETVAAWLDRRYGLAGTIDPERMVLPLNGTREGLFFAATSARTFLARRGHDKARPAVLVPNPFYQAYAAGAEAAGAEVVVVESGHATGFLPDFAGLPADLLDRTIAAYVASPVNPQGTVAGRAEWDAMIALARRHDFMLFADECYSELYRSAPPVGLLEAAHATGAGFANVVAFHSLSKRSNLPGLRCGFAAGDPDFLDHSTELRNRAAPQVPLPIQAAAIAAYRDEAHVAANRALYNDKYRAADAIVGDRFGYVTPPGGFFLWLDMSAEGGGEAAAVRLWREAGVRSLPGAYLCVPGADGANPGEAYLRLAMVNDLAATREALTRLVQLFDP